MKIAHAVYKHFRIDAQSATVVFEICKVIMKIIVRSAETYSIFWMMKETLKNPLWLIS